jgi:hypothetical protein
MIMGPKSLFTAVASHISDDPILHRLCSLIPHLGLKTRKVILDMCQTERISEEMDDPARRAKEIWLDIRSRDESSPSQRDITEMLDHIAHRPVYRAFISMMVRNEIADQFSGANEAMKEGFEKEWRAGQVRKDEDLRISYQVLDQDNFAPSQYSIYYDLTPWWTRYAQNLCSRFSSKLERMGVIYPQVQRRKNMGRSTCRELALDGYETLDWTQLRTLDLELHSYKTGRRIGGPCELRMAWKFNELKPRLYYCIGGTAYWSSRHVKRLAVALMESIDSTKLARRQHPEDIMYHTETTDWIALWDMSAFTSSLSELKYFIYYLCKNLEEDIRVQQHPLRIFDYKQGVIEITADKLLQSYNTVVNQESSYEIDRVMHKLFDSVEEDEEMPMEMKNSGPLGVHGNIGLSTAYHGFHAEAAIERGSGCGVGDDCLGALKEDPTIRFFHHMKLIGDIAVEKADILPPMTEDIFEQVTKFVKRRFTRSHDGISIGILYAFPSLAGVFGLSDEYHTIIDMPLDARISRFCMQVGSFFWDLHATGWVDEDSYQLVVRILTLCYKTLNLDTRGSLPGRRHPAFTEGMMFAVPPIMFDFTSVDWSEYLWDTTSEKFALLPLQLGETVIPPYEEGLWFHCTEGPLLNILEDVGCIKKGRMLTEWLKVDVTNRRVFRSFLESSRRTFACQYLSHVPEWLDEVLYSYVDAPPDGLV